MKKFFKSGSFVAILFIIIVTCLYTISFDREAVFPPDVIKIDEKINTDTLSIDSILIDPRTISTTTDPEEYE